MRHLYICDFHKNFIQSVRNKRKRKTSDDGGESPDHDVEVPEVMWTEMSLTMFNTDIMVEAQQSEEALPMLCRGTRENRKPLKISTHGGIVIRVRLHNHHYQCFIKVYYYYSF